MKSTPIAALEALLNIEPLHIYIESVARATCIRLNQSYLLSQSNYGHASIWYKLVEESPSIEMPHDIISPVYRFDNSFQLKLPTREDWKNDTAIPNNNCITWYSDGSKYDNLAGSGIYCPQTQLAISYPQNAAKNF